MKKRSKASFFYHILIKSENVTSSEKRKQRMPLTLECVNVNEKNTLWKQTLDALKHAYTHSSEQDSRDNLVQNFFF